MSFKINLLKKIKIDMLVQTVLATLGPVGSEMRIDKKAMRSLLEMAPYEYKRVRDLDLYIKAGSDQRTILVLDSDLPIYNTTIEDVALRKSPLIKEIISIRNIIKILNDADVITSKKDESLRIVQNECLEQLDLSCGAADIEAICKDGVYSYEKGDKNGVMECLYLFIEMLGYSTPPKTFKVKSFEIFGELVKREDGEVLYGPAVIYDSFNNDIKLVDDQIRKSDNDKVDMFHNIVAGKAKASQRGYLVFDFLKEEAIKKCLK